MKTIIELEKERFEWSLKTFSEATAISSLWKLKSEIKEIETDILFGVVDPEEYADALMCLFDSAGRNGISVERIFESFAKKHEINKKRIWRKNSDNSYSHFTPVKVESSIDQTLPKTLDEAVDYLLPRFDGMEKAFLTTEDDFAVFCHSQMSGGIGMKIRNELGLWSKDSDVYKYLVEVYKLEHPDDMSDLILRKIYRKKNNVEVLK